MNEHTPGPWRVREFVDGSLGIYGKGEYDIVATVHIDDGTNIPQAVADAYLIVAAPQMLEALEGAYELTELIRYFLGAPERGGYDLEGHAHRLQDQIVSIKAIIQSK